MPVLYTLSRTMHMNLHNTYKLKLCFEHGTAQEFKECITHAKGIELFLRNIHTVQSSASVLEFESERDRSYAMLLLSSDPLYTLSCVD